MSNGTQRQQRQNSHDGDDTRFYSYEPAKGHGLPHEPLNAIVGPRAIGWISTKGMDGVCNLAPYSFFSLYNYKPAIIGFTSRGRKDSLINAEATGQFCWNLVTKSLAKQMNITSMEVGPEVDEFKLSGLTPIPSTLIDVPRVAESPVSFECKVTQILQLAGVDGKKADTWLVLGEVVAVHIERQYLFRKKQRQQQSSAKSNAKGSGQHSLSGATVLAAAATAADDKEALKEGIYDTAAPNPIFRAGGPSDYFELGPLFKMPKPTKKEAEEAKRKALLVSTTGQSKL